MRFRGSTLFLVVSTVLAAAPARAQGGAVLRGRVVEADTGSGVGAAQVTVDERTGAVADGTGRFVIAGLAPGSHRLHVARIGYDPQDVDVVLGDSLDLVVALSPRPRELDGLDVTGATAPPARLAAFEYRRAHHSGGGRFFGRTELEVMRGTTLVDVLRRIPGAHLVQAPPLMGTFLTGSSLAPQPLMRLPRPCFAQVFVDGTQIYAMEMGSDPPNLETFRLDDLDGLEYYSISGNTPAEFRTTTSSCGTLLLWTRAAG
jgi:hypothetical protein